MLGSSSYFFFQLVIQTPQSQRVLGMRLCVFKENILDED